MATDHYIIMCHGGIILDHNFLYCRWNDCHLGIVSRKLPDRIQRIPNGHDSELNAIIYLSS